MIKLKINIQNLNVNYIQYGEGQDILLLHGWGQNIEMMKPIGDNFCDKFRITILDFPGFGQSDEPTEPWNIEKYVCLVEELADKLKIKKPIVIGHSFGGRVAIKFSSRNPIEKLVLFGSPCIRIQENLSLSVRLLKKIKKLPGMNGIGEYMKQFIGSRDYKAASPVMRQTLVEVVNEDLSKYAREKIMVDAALITMPGTHYAYLENLGQVVNILNNFF